LKLYQKNHIVVRYFQGGNVYGFRTTLIGLIKEPVRLFILAYPEIVDSLNVRKNERYSCLISACVRALSTDQEELELQGFICDISIGGCKFESSISNTADRPNIKLGQYVELSLQFPQEEVWRMVQAEIRMLNVDNIKVMIGLQYTPDENQEIQLRVVDDIQMYINSL
jgi:c-di-GMP-binding flagellar brake protein YcgR